MLFRCIKLRLHSLNSFSRLMWLKYHDLFGTVCSLCYSFVRIAEQHTLRSRPRCKVSKVGTVGGCALKLE